MYRGEYSGSWPEMADMAGFADKLTVSQIMELFIDCHSYSQLLLTPYSYSCVNFPETNGRHIRLMEATAEAIYSVYETNYTFGPGCETLYPTNGESYEYPYDVNGTEWSSFIELKDTGAYGFILPPGQILQDCEESWAMMRVMLARIQYERQHG
jgi:hypothetical protein